MKFKRAIAGLGITALGVASLFGVACDQEKEVFPTEPAKIERMEWQNPLSNGQIILPNHSNLLRPPVVSDDAKKIIYQADFAGYTDQPLFPPESNPGETFFADSDNKRLIAFPASYYPIIPSDDFEKIVYGWFSKSGLAIYLLDLETVTTRELTSGGPITGQYDLSGNGKRLAFTKGKINYEIRDGSIFTDLGGPETTDHEVYVLNLKTGKSTNISDSPSYDDGPRISEDGSRVAFLSLRDGNVEVYLAEFVDDNWELKNISQSEEWEGEHSISSDGNRIAYLSRGEGDVCGEAGLFCNRIRVYDTRLGDFVYTSEYSDFEALQILPSGNKIAVLEEERIEPPSVPGQPEFEYRLKIIDINSGERITIPGDARGFAISPNGKRIGYIVVVGDEIERRIPTDVTDSGMIYGTTKSLPAYKGFIKEIE